MTPATRTIDTEAFRAMGVNMMAYVRPASFDGVDGFAVIAADGETIGFLPTRAAAEAAIVQHDMEPVSLH